MAFLDLARDETRCKISSLTGLNPPTGERPTDPHPNRAGSTFGNFQTHLRLRIVGKLRPKRRRIHGLLNIAASTHVDGNTYHSRRVT